MNSIDMKSISFQSMTPNLQAQYNAGMIVNVEHNKPENYENGSCALKKNNALNSKNELFSHIESNSAKSVLKDTNSLFQCETVQYKENSLNNIVNSESVSLEISNLLFSCCTCGETFETSKVFKKHACDKKSVSKPLECRFCPLTFNQKNHLNKHILGHKKNNCTICKAQFTKRKALCRHLKAKHNIIEPEKVYDCSFCEKKFPKKFYLVDHLKIHANGQHVCLKCGFMCAGDYEYAQHRNEHVQESKYDCHLCGKKFVRRQQHDQHMMGHNRHLCSWCNVTFSTKKMFLKHQQSVHGIKHELPKMFSCNICKKGFKKYHQLFLHTRIHTEEKPHKCSYCDQSFRYNRSLTKHMKSVRHIERVSAKEGKVVKIEKPYQCFECGIRFYRHHSLFRHIKVLHSSRETFKCSQCEYQTKCKTNLKRHENCHSDVKHFICKICGQSFRALATLKEHHIFLHTEDRCFTCSICSKSFKSKSILQRHYKTHCEIRPFKCHCDKKFKRMSHLKRHMASVHNSVQNDANQSSNDVDSDVPSIDTFSQISQEALASLVIPVSNCNLVDSSTKDACVEKYECSVSDENQYMHVPSTSIQSLIANNIHLVPDNDPKDAFSSHSSSTPLPANNSADVVSLDDTDLNLSPSNFCNFNLVLSDEINNNTPALDGNTGTHDILSFPPSTDFHSLSNLDFQNQPASVDTLLQLPPNSDSAGLQVLAFLLNGGISSLSPANSVTLEQSACSKNIFGDSDESLPFSPYPYNNPPGFPSENIFNSVRDLDLWDLQNCKFKPSYAGNQDNLPSSANNILPPNLLFSNESLMALDSNALSSELDALNNLC